MKKYKLDRKDKIKAGNITLYRIIALKSFGCVTKGDKGGYIQAHKNLSHLDDAWVSGNAQVYGNAWVYGDARVSGNAWVYGKENVGSGERK